MALFRTGLYVKNHSVEKVQIAKTPIASYNGNVTGLYIPELIAYITAKQSGSGTPSPDNIRPIIGASECNVVRCGKNLVANKKYQYNANNVFLGVDNADITHTIFLKEGTYTISYDSSVTGVLNVGNSQTSWNTSNKSYTFTVSTPDYYRFWVYKNGITVSDITSFQLEFGSTATAYEAYTGNTYTIQFGQTVYVCYINVTTGELTIIAKYLSFNSAEYYGTFGVDNAPMFYVDITGQGIKRMFNAGREGILLSNMLSKISASGAAKMKNYEIRTDGDNNTTRLYFRIDDCTSQADIDTFFVDRTLQVVAELATPITVQLTPIQVEQLLGTNNVWADTGDVEVKFYNVIR